MPDNSHDTEPDGWFALNRANEMKNLVQAIRTLAAGRSDADIIAAINACRKGVKPAEGRAKLMECVKRRLSV